MERRFYTVEVEIDQHTTPPELVQAAVARHVYRYLRSHFFGTPAGIVVRSVRVSPEGKGSSLPATTAGVCEVTS